MAKDTIRKILRQSDVSFKTDQTITVARDRERKDISNMILMVAMNVPYVKFKPPYLIEIINAKQLILSKKIVELVVSIENNPFK